MTTISPTTGSAAADDATDAVPAADAPLLDIRGLRTDIVSPRRTVHAVRGVDLTVRAGETVGLVGESGSGKTMTGLSVLRLLPPGGRIVGGSILFDGRDLAGLSISELRQIRGSDIGFVFQDPATSLNPTMTIGLQIAEVVRTHRGVSWDRARARAVEILDLVGMPRPAERLGDYPHQLSGGLRQRVMIAMALACEPRLLIADEPTTALDVTISDQILGLLDELKTTLGMGMLLVTHDLGVIADRADRVVVMYAGKVAETAVTDALFRDRRHRYTAALLRAIPTGDTDTARPLYAIPGTPPSLVDPPRGCAFAARCAGADQHCHDELPPIEQAGPGHTFACFHPVDAAEQPEDTTTSPRAQSSRTEAVPLMQLREVVKEYPTGAGLSGRSGETVKAVSGVTLEVIRHESLGLVGESGSGKSTLGRMMVGLEPLTSGTVTVDGQDLARTKGSRRRALRSTLQLMFQDPYSSLDPRMRVDGIIAEPLQIQGVGNRRQRTQRVADLLDMVGLPASAGRQYPHEFSGGQRQRIGLARALALQPRLLVADEPVSALDVSIQAQILNLMRDLRDEFDLTYVFISHDLSVVRYIADRIAVMYLGKVVEIGPAQQVYDQPAHPYTRGLLDAAPDPVPGRERTGVSIRGELPSPIHPPSGCRFRTRCPRAASLCAELEPPTVRFGDGHLAACHFPLRPASPADQSVPTDSAPAAAPTAPTGADSGAGATDSIPPTQHPPRTDRGEQL